MGDREKPSIVSPEHKAPRLDDPGTAASSAANPEIPRFPNIPSDKGDGKGGTLGSPKGTGKGFAK